jgi:hypothetical protein
MRLSKGGGSSSSDSADFSIKRLCNSLASSILEELKNKLKRILKIK